MSDMQVLNLEAFNAMPLTESPFPFMVIKDFVKPEFQQAIMDEFPKIDCGGLYPEEILKYGTHVGQLVKELRGEDLRKAVADKFDLSLENCPTMLTFRNYARQKDGRIHADTKSKLVSMLLYLNKEWPYQGGQLRLLRDPKDMESTIVEIPPVAGTLVIFKVTPNGWHGHHKFVGQRRAIMMNYIVNQQAFDRELAKHRFSAKVKRFKHILGIGRGSQTGG